MFSIKSDLHPFQFTWSPSSTLLALGSSDKIQIFGCEKGTFGDLALKKSFDANEVINKLTWGEPSISTMGVIAGAFPSGNIGLWNVQKLLEGEKGTIPIEKVHTGSVTSLDFNSNQKSLLASGGPNGEILIWDLSQGGKHFAIGEENKNNVNILSLNWNKVVPAVLSAVNENGVVIYDLRKKQDKSVWNYKSKNSLLEWHPKNPFILAVVDNESEHPQIKIWDLKAGKASAVLSGHTATINSLSWSKYNDNLLLSSSKDNTVRCWNTEHYSLMSIVESGSEYLDVKWAPIPSGISIAESNQYKHISVQDFTLAEDSKVEYLPKQPSWLARPVGASFGFGGKFVTFGKDGKSINISRLNVTDGTSSNEKLTNALTNNTYVEYCEEKISESKAPEKDIWSFLKVLCHKEPRIELIKYLGFDPREIKSLVQEFIDKNQGTVEENKTEEKEDNDEVRDLFGNSNDTYEIGNNTGDNTGGFGESIAFEDILPIEFHSNDSYEEMITKALLIGDLQLAIDCCFKANRTSDALIIASTGPRDLFIKVQQRYLKSNDDSFTRMLSLLVNRDLNSLAKRTDLKYWKELLAIFCTYAKNFPELCDVVGDRLVGEEKNNNRALLFYICAGSISKAISIWNDSEDTNSVIEKVLVWNQIAKDTAKITNPYLVNLYVRYAETLTSSGKLDDALKHLKNIQEPNDKVQDLIDRIQKSLGIVSSKKEEKKEKKETFTKVNVGPSTGNFNVPPSNHTQPQQFIPPPTTKSSPKVQKPKTGPQPVFLPPTVTHQPTHQQTHQQTHTFEVKQESRSFNMPSPKGFVPPQRTGPGIVTPQPSHHIETIQPTPKKPKTEEEPVAPPPMGVSAPKSKKSKKETQNM